LDLVTENKDKNEAELEKLIIDIDKLLSAQKVILSLSISILENLFYFKNKLNLKFASKIDDLKYLSIPNDISQATTINQKHLEKLCWLVRVVMDDFNSGLVTRILLGLIKNHNSNTYDNHSKTQAID
jgi:hypothetical protein